MSSKVAGQSNDSGLPSGKAGGGSDDREEELRQRPLDVAGNPDLTKKAKQRALDEMEVDAQALERSEGEGMGGGEPTNLAEVAEAKAKVGGFMHKAPGQP